MTRTSSSRPPPLPAPRAPLAPTLPPLRAPAPPAPAPPQPPPILPSLVLRLPCRRGGYIPTYRGGNRPLTAKTAWGTATTRRPTAGPHPPAHPPPHPSPPHWHPPPQPPHSHSPHLYSPAWCYACRAGAEGIFLPIGLGTGL